jgi:major membrane immunogen (membrane-anchored lipoprotein)
MKTVICVVIVALIGLAGCGQSDAPAVDEPQATEQVETTDAVVDEDFEAGEPEAMVEVDDTDTDEAAPEGSGH